MRKPKKAPDTGLAKRLTDDIRAEIVMRLAMYDKAADIQRDLKDKHGIEVSLQAICTYDPGRGVNGTRCLSKKWVALFHHTREEWLKEMAAEPIANRAYRLRRLGIIHDRAMSRNALPIAMSALEQAAKEVGNVYTNVQKSTGVVGHLHVHQERTPEESRIMLADRIAEALAKLPKPAKVIEQN